MMMAPMLSPVCTDALKFQSPFSCNRSRRLARPRPTTSISGRRRDCKIKAMANDYPAQEAVADDYYGVLGLLPDATPQQIKKAYYNCMKACHPDLSGNDTDTTNFCMFINEVYAVLSDPVQRMIYDEIHGYALTAINPFLDDTSPKDHAFVDEFSCIGCKNCANVAPDVFGIEEDFGRARVCNQSGNPDLVQQAIDSCPVDCIHWTSAAQISLLEDEMRRVEKVNVALMLAGMGATSDVFRMVRILMEKNLTTIAYLQKIFYGNKYHLDSGIWTANIIIFDASSRWEKRQMKVLEKAKMKMSKKKGSDKAGSHWSDLWGRPKNYETTEEEVKERAKSAAAAARRWREYSRKGADRRPTFKLPEAMSNKE